MCLTIRNNVKCKFNQSGEITAYKVYMKTRRGRLISYYQGKLVRKPGQVISDRAEILDIYTEELSREKRTGEVDFGIHVFLDRFSAKRAIASTIVCGKESCTIVPVRCKKRDLVATGHYHGDNSAVFDKVLIEKRTWKRLGLK